jgi:hypothetical protein
MRIFFLFVVRWVPNGEEERMRVMVVAVVVSWWVGYGLKLGVDLFDLADVASKVCSCDVCLLLICGRVLGRNEVGKVELGNTTCGNAGLRNLKHQEIET